jgi:hypothetical protein
LNDQTKGIYINKGSHLLAAPSSGISNSHEQAE